MTDDRRRDCVCPRARHEHGTALAYKKDRCRCAPCTAASTADQAAYRALVATGEERLVDPTLTRERVRILVSLGMTPDRLAARTGFSVASFHRLVEADARETITKAFQDAVLAIHLPRPGDVNPYALVDPKPVLVRLRALVAVGWTKPRIAEEAGLPLGTIRSVLDDGRRPTVTTRDAVLVAFERLRNVRPMPRRRGEKQGIAAARARAAERGWRTPDRLTEEELYFPRARRAA